MNDNQERLHLAQSDRHIALAKEHIARQLLIIEQLAAAGQPTDDAWSTLAVFKNTLRSFERHRATILSVLKVCDTTRPMSQSCRAEPPAAQG